MKMRGFVSARFGLIFVFVLLHRLQSPAQQAELNLLQRRFFTAAELLHLDDSRDVTQRPLAVSSSQLNYHSLRELLLLLCVCVFSLLRAREHCLIGSNRPVLLRFLLLIIIIYRASCRKKRKEP